MTKIPYYLIQKLKKINIDSLFHVKQFNPLILFQRLKFFNNGLNYNALYDLHCLYNDLPIMSLSMEDKNKLVNQYLKLPPFFGDVTSDLIKQNMQLAVDQANYANDLGEVPIGAIITYNNNSVIAVGYNQTISGGSALLHAEIVAIQSAQKTINNYRLNNCDMYVTIEPCLMCSGAIINSRIRRVIFGANEPKTGAIASQYKVFDNTFVNKHTQIIGPIDNELYSQQVRDFFSKKRCLVD